MITRREFSTYCGVAATARAQVRLSLADIPNFCSHEHWGSIDSSGTIPGGDRCDYEQRDEVEFEFTDSARRKQNGERRLCPVATVKAGRIYGSASIPVERV
jgi:hypothetical protein